MIASSIGVVVLTAIMAMLVSVWMLAKENSDELQGALRARYDRERLYYSCYDENGSHKGLLNATNITVSADELIAAFKSGTLCVRQSLPADYVMADLDASTGNVYRDPSAALQYVYLSVKIGSTVYHNRIVVPVWSRHPKAEEMYECFGE